MRQKISLTLLMSAFFVLPLACQGQKPTPLPTSTLSVTTSLEKAPEPAPPSPTASPTSNPATSETDAANKWIEGMTALLPNLFCKEGSYFRECFKVNAQECETEATRATRACLQSKDAEIRANLKIDKGKTSGQKLGECAGDSYELSLKDKRIDNPKCNDPSKWM